MACHKRFKEEGYLYRVKRSGRQGVSKKDSRTSPGNIFAKPQDVHKKSMSGNPDSYEDRLACRRETLANHALKVSAGSALKGSWQAKAQTILCRYERITWKQALRISIWESVLLWRLLAKICWACLARTD